MSHGLDPDKVVYLLSRIAPRLADEPDGDLAEANLRRTTALSSVVPVLADDR